MRRGQFTTRGQDAQKIRDTAAAEAATVTRQMESWRSGRSDVHLSVDPDGADGRDLIVVPWDGDSTHYNQPE